MKKFGYIVKTSVFILGLAAFGLAPAAQAMADQKHTKHRIKHRYNDHSYGYDRHNDRHRYDRHNNWRGNYWNNNRRHNWRHNRRHNNHGGEVALGMLAGGLMFYALTSNQRSNNYNRNIYVQQQPVYVQPQQQWTQRRPVQPQQPDRSCLQVREYQTTITVGGQNVPAYGKSCLQPDGTWKLGPAIPEPGY